jgi:hypothetical protein
VSENIDEEIGYRVRKAMWRRQVTQVAVAKVLKPGGVDQAVVSRHLRGKTQWKVSALVAVAELLDMDVCALIPTRSVIRDDADAECKWTRPWGQRSDLRRVPAPRPGSSLRRAAVLVGS